MNDAAFDGTSSTCYDCGPTHIRFINGEFDGSCDVPGYDCHFDTTGRSCFLGGGESFEFINMEVHNCKYGFYLGGQNSLVDASWFHHNIGYAIHMYCNPAGGCGADPQPIDNNIIRNTLFEYNGSSQGPCTGTILLADGHNKQVVDDVDTVFRVSLSPSFPRQSHMWWRDNGF